MTIKTFCIVCGRKQQYKLGSRRRLRSYCSQQCCMTVHKMKIKLIDSDEPSIRRKAHSRIAKWLEEQSKILREER